MAQDENGNELDLTAIAARIRKLLILADETRGATPQEAASAAAKAQALLFRYNLKAEEVKEPDADPLAAFDRKRFEINGAMHRDVKWRRDLLHNVARFNFCKATWGTGLRGGKWASLIGKPHNIEVALHLFEYLNAEIDRLYKVAWSDHKQRAAAGIVSLQNWVVFKHEYCLGAVQAIAMRLREQYNASKKQADAEARNAEAAGATGADAPISGTALIVVSDEQLELAVKKFAPKVKSDPLEYGRRGDGSGYARGYRDGSRIQINPAVKAPSYVDDRIG